MRRLRASRSRCPRAPGNFAAPDGEAELPPPRPAFTSAFINLNLSNGDVRLAAASEGAGMGCDASGAGARVPPPALQGQALIEELSCVLGAERKARSGDNLNLNSSAGQSKQHRLVVVSGAA